MKCAEIRQKFIEYYQSLNFQHLDRASMMHPSIPLSFVMSAGLVQVETSLANSQNRSGDKFVLVQNCFRHFDLKSIGSDNIHLSLFEMPGAFVFGNDGREKIIAQMWELVTEILLMDPRRIWASYFGGETFEHHKLPKDELSYQTWRDIGLPENRLVGLGVKHNYWIQGNGSNNGTSHLRKCGPNTELFYDLGIEYSCGPHCRPGCRCGRFIEFANSLFILYNFHPQKNVLAPMDDPYSETVIGTERIAMLLQNVPSVFETQDYYPIINGIHQFVTCNDVPNDFIRESERVIADHLRSLYTLITDGAPPPGKNGRERIIKLLIRGVITRQILLGITAENFFSKVIQLIDSFMRPENTIIQSRQLDRIQEYIDAENQRFKKTIERGRRELQRMLRKNQGQTLTGSQITFLEKRKGFPNLLTAKILRQRGLHFAEREYKEALILWEKQDVTHEKSGG